jgi:hypothetical protein
MRRLPLLIILTFAALLAACAPGAGATPALIGAFPQGNAPAATAAPAGAYVVGRDASLFLLVPDVNDAIAAANRLAVNSGGYATEPYTWVLDGTPQATFSVIVPLSQYNTVRAALVNLGELQTEIANTQVTTAGAAIAPAYTTTFFVHVTAAGPSFSWPALPDFGWHPEQTFASAFRVSAAILTTVADLAIWLTVVFGPFVLLALGLRRLFGRARPVASAPVSDSSEEKQS